MGIVSTIAELFEASTQSANHDGARETGVPAGAYWCNDCAERIPASDVEREAPPCPVCGEPMTFERSPGTAGCAC